MNHRFKIAWCLGVGLLAGCATAETKTPTPETPKETEAEVILYELIRRSNRYTSFHVVYELTEESSGETARLEIAFRAPDRAKVIYSAGSSTHFADGTGRVYSEAGTSKRLYVLPYLSETTRLLESYKEARQLAGKLFGLEMPEPEIFFGIAGWDALRDVKALKTLIGYSADGARFDWLRLLRHSPFVFEKRDGKFLFHRDGDGMFIPGIEIVIAESGFIERVRMIQSEHPSFTLWLKSVAIDTPLDDSVFAVPDPSEYQDLSPEAGDRLRETIANRFQRHLLESVARQWEALPEARRPEVANLFESLLRVNLKRTYETEKPVKSLNEELDRTLAEHRREREKSPNPKKVTESMIEKVKAKRDAYSLEIDTFERGVRRDFGRFLEETFRGMSPCPRPEVRADLSALWEKAVSAQIQAQIRRPFQSAFDERLKALEKESK